MHRRVLTFFVPAGEGHRSDNKEADDDEDGRNENDMQFAEHRQFVRLLPSCKLCYSACMMILLQW